MDETTKVSSNGQRVRSLPTLSKTAHVLTRAQFHHIVSDASKSHQDGPRGVVVEIDDTEDVSHCRTIVGLSSALSSDTED